MSIYYCNQCKDEAYVRFLKSAKRIDDQVTLSFEECKVFYELVKYHYISYENGPGHELVNKIMQFIEQRKG